MLKFFNKIRNLYNDEYVAEHPEYEMAHYCVYILHELVSTTFMIAVMGIVAYLLLTFIPLFQ